jgi:hypothetical protein
MINKFDSFSSSVLPIICFTIYKFNRNKNKSGFKIIKPIQKNLNVMFCQYKKTIYLRHSNMQNNSLYCLAVFSKIIHSILWSDEWTWPNNIKIKNTINLPQALRSKLTFI